MRARATIALMFVALGTSACGRPEVVRSTEGVLTLVGEYPRTVNAMSTRGTLVAHDGCLIFQQENGTVLQPAFPEGVTYADLDRQFGSLSRPRAVSISGFDVGGNLPLAIAESAITKRCPGAPFVFGSIDIAHPDASQQVPAPT